MIVSFFFVQASKAPPMKSTMLQRQEEAIQQKQARLLQLKKEREEDEEKARMEYRKAVLDHIQKPLPKHELTWKEIEEQNEIRRKERVEKFKQHLLVTCNAKLGSLAVDTKAEKTKLLLQKVKEEDEEKRRFLAEDPQKVHSRV